MPESDNNIRDPIGRVPSRGVVTGAVTRVVGRLPSAGVVGDAPTTAGSGDPAYRTKPHDVVSRVPPRGAVTGAVTRAVGRLPSAGAPHDKTDPPEPPPRRLRRLHRVWPDRDGNLSYLLTFCVDGRVRVLDNEDTFARLTAFLLDSPARYRWFPRRFVVMPDHLHLIAHPGHEAVRLGQWIKALKAVVGGLERRADVPANEANLRVGASDRPVRAPGLQDQAPPSVGRLPSAGVAGDAAPPAGSGDPAYKTSPGAAGHEFTRRKHSWRWQDGFHDHKFRTPESEQRKWEYVCLNPVRYGLVERPEQWPFGGEIFYDEAGGPRLVPRTPPLLETGLLVNEGTGAPDEGTGPAPGTHRQAVAAHVSARGVVGRLPPAGAPGDTPPAGSGDPAYKTTRGASVGRVPSCGVAGWLAPSASNSEPD